MKWGTCLPGRGAAGTRRGPSTPVTRGAERAGEKAVTSGAAPPGADRVVAVDALRGVAALVVLIHHGVWGHIVQALWDHGTVFWFAYPFLQPLGVHMFMLVSGFCIHARAARRNPNRPAEFMPFWRRRFCRLYPPFLAALVFSLITVGLLAAVELAGAGELVDAGSVWRRVAPDGGQELGTAGLVHLFLLYPFWPRAVFIFNNPVLWTLALEEHLYLMYFAVPWLRSRLGLGRSLALILGVTLAWRFMAVFGPFGHSAPVLTGPVLRHVGEAGPAAHFAWLQMGPSRWFEWVLGVVAVERAFGLLPSRWFHTSLPLAAIAAAAAMACQWSHLGWVFTDPLWGVALFILLNRVVDAERAGRFGRSAWMKALLWFRGFSYSTYLIHVPLLLLVQPILLLVLPWPVALPLGTLLVIPFARWFYHFFEGPALRWARAASQRPPGA